MALKCYLDGSQKHGRQLTLAAIAGDEPVWAALDKDWTDFLAHMSVPYSHMKEAIARKGPFQGWEKEKRDWFVNGLITFFNTHRAKYGRLKAFTSSVDLKAHTEISARIPGLPAPSRMCARGIILKVFEWYGGFPDPILDVVDLYFDRGEPFMQHIDVDWKSPEFRKAHPVWELVRTISPVEMSTTPGIQVADLFAWARIRIDTRGPGDRFYGPAGLLCHPASADHWVFDRAKMETYPPYSIM
jgi:hypothetical protein